MSNNVHRGVVYRYTLHAPGNEKDGWSYIGETENETKRLLNWNHKGRFGGKKIGDARSDYGVSNDVWKYEILEEIEECSKEALRTKLVERESYYIQQYDSFEHGFNSNLGGLGNKGIKFSDDWKKNISEAKRGKPHPISPEGLARINANRYRIAVIAIHKDGSRMEFNSLSEAAQKLKVSVAAISMLLKTGNVGRHGYRIIKKSKQYEQVEN